MCARCELRSAAWIAKLFPGIECTLYSHSRTPGSQWVYIDSMDGVLDCVGDRVRKLDLNVRQAIPPGIYYGLEEMQRVLRGIVAAEAVALTPCGSGTSVFRINHR